MKMQLVKSNLRSAALLALGALWVAFETTRSGAQPFNGYPGGMPPPFVQASTLAGTLRNAAQAVATQCNITRQAAASMGQRAQSPVNWQQYFITDYQNLQFQFNALRYTFGLLNQLVPQLQSPRASNAAAELEAGLNIIAEGFEPVQQEW